MSDSYNAHTDRDFDKEWREQFSNNRVNNLGNPAYQILGGNDLHEFDHFDCDNKNTILPALMGQIAMNEMPMVELDPDDLTTFMSETENIMSPDSQMHVSSTALSPYSEYTQVMSPSSILSHTTVPSVTPYPGDYGFEVSVQKQTKATKSANWIFSKKMDKLYVKMKTPCPFLFRTAIAPPPGSTIRALPIYFNPEHMSEIARRCPTHVASAQNESDQQKPHLVTSDHRQAQHEQDSKSMRLSVVIPYEEPQVGSKWVTSLYQFMCYSSCHGGYNRRPLHVIFTLEHRNQVLGRQVIKVRLCACPGRDWVLEENPPEKKKVPVAGKRRLSSGMVEGSDAINSDYIPEKLVRGSNDEIFTLQIRGRGNYEMLRKIYESLQIVSCLPQEVVNKIRSDQDLVERSVKTEQPPTQQLPAGKVQKINTAHSAVPKPDFNGRNNIAIYPQFSKQHHHQQSY